MSETTTPHSLSVVIPTRNGGELLARVVRSIFSQRTTRPLEVWLVDSGSAPEELAALTALGARVERIPSESFDHGATRDLGASLSRGDILVFLNQDALPAAEEWLEDLVAPLLGPDGPSAVQGAIREFPVDDLARQNRRRFFWDSCGPRFYFTSESESWIAEHGGVGFSTVNCAMLRSAWEQLPFGRTAILEDKAWQGRAHERDWRIATAPGAVVWHTHDYSLPALVRRCVSEGFGWRLVGVHYPLFRALADLSGRAVWLEWLRGVRTGEGTRAAELLFPILRPLALWWGNRIASRGSLGRRPSS